MEQRKAMIRQANSEGMTVKKACKIMSITKHQYYHKPSSKKRGLNPSTHTSKLVEVDEIIEVPNEEIANKIIENKQNELKRYGYQKMTSELQLEGYLINNKKVYRIMRDQGLLNPPREKAKKEYVKYRSADTTRPYEIIEMDIKQISIIGTSHFAYILTVIDTFTRKALEWTVGLQMKQDQVKAIIEKIIIQHLQMAGIKARELRVELRSDNGSQFEAKRLREFIKENGIDQVFTHPYTPQENGHIESFHSILSEAIGENEFDSISRLEEWLKKFYKHYNQERLHGSICHLPPETFQVLYEEDYIKVQKKDRKIKLKLSIPMHQVKKTIKEIKEKKQIMDNGSRSEPLSCLLKTSEGNQTQTGRIPIINKLALANN